VTTTQATTKATEPEPGFLKLLTGLGTGLLGAAMAFAVVLGLTGQFGEALKGIPLAAPPDNAPSQGATRWGLAIAATVLVATASLIWQQRRPVLRGPVPALLLVASVALGLALGDLITWALIALPVTVFATAVVGIQALRLRQEPQRKPFGAPLPQLASGALLGLAYAVLMGVAVALA
jgi:hypothetical protein